MLGAVSALTWRLLPSIRKSGNGRLLNIASFAARVPGGGEQTLYAAVKAFMVRLSESLALENADCGVHVAALCPSFTYSKFHDVTGTRAAMSRLPRRAWLDADAVADAGIVGVERGRVIVIPGTVYRTSYCFTHHMPDRWMQWLMGKSSRRMRHIAP